MKTPLPKNETERLNVLKSFQILDTPPEPSYDDITRLASYVCETPIALISLVDSDRLWFKSRIGLNLSEASREIAFCAHAILQPDIFVVPDTREDQRFADNPLVTGEPQVRFYAAAPLITTRGEALGTICVIDQVPKTLNDKQRELLGSLSRQVMVQLELHRHIQEQERQTRLMEEYQKTLKETNTRLEEAVLTDDVTGFRNTRFLHEYLGDYLAPDNVSHRKISLVFFDMDDFKRAVDAHGHLMGSRMLREVAQTVHRLLGPEDHLVRYGGDEFIVLLPGQGRKESYPKVVRMKNEIHDTPFLHGENLEVRLTASFSLATCPDDATDLQQLLAVADHYLFRSKEKGKDCITLSEIR
ncbi:MAG TPA: sensor domain-containing diguanylate cyclase [Desulfobacteraceae bacterium]|nr:sensor domain-containing diguanylate cyclase [Desulfobacteraceae bacterium]